MKSLIKGPDKNQTQNIERRTEQKCDATHDMSVMHEVTDMS